jgi:hypothetical protein
MSEQDENKRTGLAISNMTESLQNYINDIGLTKNGISPLRVDIP